jgi:hypothetical protein
MLAQTSLLRRLDNSSPLNHDLSKSCGAGFVTDDREMRSGGAPRLIGRITAAALAAAALISALITLSQAARNGWKEALNWIPGVGPAAPASSQFCALRNDTVAQLQDDSQRRLARQDLADQIECASPQAVADLIGAMERRSYRYRTGVAVALGSVEPCWRSARPDESDGILNRLGEAAGADGQSRAAFVRAQSRRCP